MPSGEICFKAFSASFGCTRQMPRKVLVAQKLKDSGEIQVWALGAQRFAQGCAPTTD
jgi:hypothetical protein